MTDRLTEKRLHTQNIKSLVEECARIFVRVWPLQSFIACNPLAYFEQFPFDQAFKASQTILGWRETLVEADFQYWHSQGALPVQTVLERFDQEHHPDGNHCFHLEDRPIFLKQILQADLIATLNPRKEATTKEAESEFLEMRAQVKEILIYPNQNKMPPSQLRHPKKSPIFQGPQPPQALFQTDDQKLEEKPQETSDILCESVGLIAGEMLAEKLDEFTVKWISAYFDTGQAGWSMPNRHLGLRGAWQQLVSYDTSLSRQSRKVLRTTLAILPVNAYEALGVLIDLLKIPSDGVKPYIIWHLGRLPGWIGYIRWYNDHLEQVQGSKSIGRALLVEYLILRLSTELAMCEPLTQKHFGMTANLETVNSYCKQNQAEVAAKINMSYLGIISKSLRKLNRNKAWVSAQQCSERLLQQEMADQQADQLSKRLIAIGYELSMSFAETQRLLQDSGSDILGNEILKNLQAFDQSVKNRILREAMETHYGDSLLREIKTKMVDSGEPVESQKSKSQKPDAQAVFCIDARSEQFRLSLESSGNIQTFGFSGFFGVPARLEAFGDAYTKDLCPVLMTPRYKIQEIPVATSHDEAMHYLAAKKKTDALYSLLKALMKNAAGMFGYVEAFGLGHAVLMTLKTLFPEKMQLFRKQPFYGVKPNLAVHEHPNIADRVVYGMTKEEQAFFAETVLTMMGLIEDFSPVVIFCGHGTQTENNPYKSSLDCGACGGNPGGGSAHILAEILNDAWVRNALLIRGISISDETIFLAAEHNTTTDEVIFLNWLQYPENRPVSKERLLVMFRHAAKLNQQKREHRLPDTAYTTLARNAIDWSQVRPEWGLARNAAMVIGPRSLTSALDMEGRSFMHSYDWQCDTKDGKALETILTAPLVVAEWINMQYLFSTLDNERFGGGTKTTHNVSGKFGVMQGNRSDLQIGLPMQSLRHQENTPYHIPLRLLAVINAPYAIVENIIRRHQLLQNLFNNYWIHLVVIDPESGQFLRYLSRGSWQVWQDKSAPTELAADYAV